MDVGMKSVPKKVEVEQPALTEKSKELGFDLE